MSVVTAQSITWDSVDWATFNVVVMNMPDFPEDGEERVNIAKLSQDNGTVTQGATYGSIDFTLECAIIEPDSIADIDTKIDSIVAARKAIHAAGEQAFILGRFLDRRYFARPLAPAPVFRRKRNGATFSMRIHISNPEYEVI
jgi:phage-related protein